MKSYSNGANYNDNSSNRNLEDYYEKLRTSKSKLMLRCPKTGL